MSFQTVEDLQLKISFSNELLLNKPQILSSEECPVCLQLLCRPLNCPNGHNLCEQCYDNLKNKSCFVLQNNIINNIKQNCKQDTQICVGAIDTIQNKDEFLVCCIDNALEALKETYSFQKANKTQKGNYFYNVEGSSFGFSSQQEIQLLQSIDNACKSDKFRLSWYLNGKGGGRIMDQFDVNNSRYKKVIMLKQ
ncbi:hypothetical protein PPERSA_12562 [Pseudocohnilembus persalinus]|uniref:RING-type domain-containing protein n=1 Tax=Pseudocohnilembus persalinus TaxID=266149 RepID=A0A0V0QCC9_PSEPJ|nr:hypothetical protein PPERSA_12562 [Pseudocohnilembus persalinus]|eukprot:KRW99886.1 hypothetical protein PPERSA_12562 [Pseudocohnilembus persalinus]